MHCLDNEEAVRQVNLTAPTVSERPVARARARAGTFCGFRAWRSSCSMARWPRSVAAGQREIAAPWDRLGDRAGAQGRPERVGKAAGRMVAIVWFRRDLRVHDHRGAVGCACYLRRRAAPRSPRLRSAHSVPPSAWVSSNSRFESAAAGCSSAVDPLQRELQAEEAGATTVHLTADVAPFTRREREVRRALGSRARVCVHPVRGGPARRHADAGGAAPTPCSRRLDATGRGHPKSAAPRRLPSPPSGVAAGGRLPAAR